MNEQNATAELTAALTDLYAVLQVPQRIDGHVWYDTDPDLRAFERRVSRLRRNEVPLDDINYLFLNNCDSAQSVKYYLPRALELIAGGERFVSEYAVSMKVRQAQFTTWPAAEQEAVRRVVRALAAAATEPDRQHLLEHFGWLVF